jgi:hypothetical protein
MMATGEKPESKQDRKDRAIVSLPDDVKVALDAKREQVSNANRESLGVAVAPTRGQLVESILRDALGVPASNGK